MSFKGLYSVNKLRMIALLILEFLTSGLTIGVSYINTYQITAVKEEKWQQFIVLIMSAFLAFVIMYIGLNFCQYLIE